MKKSILIGIVAGILCFTILSAGCVHSDLTETHSPFTKVSDYCYEVTFYDYDDSAMGKYAKVLEKNPHEIGCSAVSNGNFAAHNFDYTFCDMATIVIHTVPTVDRYATIGVSGWKKEWTSRNIEGGMKAFDLSFMPYTIVDGMNEKGLVVCSNVVPAVDIGFTTCTNPNGTQNVLYTCVPRMLLDNCATVDECIEYLKNINIYNTDRHIFELHYLISDENETCLVELINNELKISKEHHYMTNFYHLLDKLTEHPIGIERYDIITKEYDSANTFEGMRKLMEDLRYSRKYDLTTDPFWISEYYGSLSNKKTTLDKDSKPSEFTNAIKENITAYNTHKRDLSLNVWKTIHCSIYDRENLTLSLYLDEDYHTKYEFDLYGESNRTV